MFTSKHILFKTFFALALVTTSAKAFAIPSDEAEPPSAAPAAEAPRPRIVKMVFKNDEGSSMPASRFAGALSLHPGDLLDFEKLSDDVAMLKQKFPEFASITTRFDPTPKKDGVVITYEFLSKRLIRFIRVVAPKGVDVPADIVSKLQSRMGGMLRGDQARQDEEILRKVFIAQGYPKAEVKLEIKKVEKARGTVELIFHVKPGSASATLGALVITGNRSFTQSVLENVIQTTRPWYSFVSGGPTLNLFELEADLAKLEDFYKSKGFAQVKINPSYTMNSRAEARVVIAIKEGPRYAVRRITVSGNKKFKTAVIAKHFTFGVNSPYNLKLVRQSLQNVRDMYGEQGYSLAKVEAEFVASSSTLKVVISEGTVQYVDRIEIVGHSTIKESTIRSYFDLREGDRVNTKSINNSIEDLRKSGFFDEVKVSQNPTGDNTNTVVVAVKESRNSSVEFGFGYGTSSGLGGDVGYSHKQSGLDFSVWALKSEEEAKLMLMFRNPRLYDSKYALNAQAGYQELDFKDKFRKTSISGRVMLERKIMRNLTLGVGTRLEFVNIDDVNAAMPAQVFDASHDLHTVAGLVSTLVYENEKLDEHGDAVGGYRVRLAMLPSYADGEAYTKASASAVAHQTLGEDQNGRKHVLSGRVTLGYASQNTPFYESYYAGGTALLRGSSTGSITPAGSPLGGKAVAGTGAYYSFPLWGEMFRGVAFVETVNVANSFEDLGDIRMVSGVGVRANLSDTFLRNKIEAGVAYPVIQQPGDIYKPFYLMFGTYHPAYDL